MLRIEEFAQYFAHDRSRRLVRKRMVPERRVEEVYRVSEAESLLHLIETCVLLPENGENGCPP